MQPQERNSRRSRESRYSWMESPQKYERNRSLSKKVSLIDAMDLQLPDPQRDSFFNQNEENRFSDRRGTSRVSRKSYSYKDDVEDKDMNRSSNYKVTHECNCSGQKCDGVHCSCFLTPREICVIGQCCPSCIENKNDFLMTTRGWTIQKQKPPQQSFVNEQIMALIKQKNIKNIHYFKQIHGNDSNIRNLVYCTCKKSQCQKKYCLCFEKGVKCGQLCNCTDCENRDRNDDEDFEQKRRWQRYGNYRPYEAQEGAAELDIDDYMQEQMREGQFNETMEFQPPNFNNMLQQS